MKFSRVLMTGYQIQNYFGSLLHLSFSVHKYKRQTTSKFCISAANTYSFCCLCYNRPTASSKASSEQTYVFTNEFCSQHNVMFWKNKDSVLVKNVQPSWNLITRIQKGPIFYNCISGLISRTLQV